MLYIAIKTVPQDHIIVLAKTMEEFFSDKKVITLGDNDMVHITIHKGNTRSVKFPEVVIIFLGAINRMLDIYKDKIDSESYIKEVLAVGATLTDVCQNFIVFCQARAIPLDLLDTEIYHRLNESDERVFVL